MPYLIKTYKRYRNATNETLVDIDTRHPYDTAEQANEAIQQLIVEQYGDNKSLVDAYYERLVSAVLDLDTDDQIPIEPTLYNYIFKSEYYTPEQVLAIP